MLHFLPPFILGSITLLLMVLNTLCLGVPLHIAALAKLVVPVPAWRRMCTQSSIRMIETWARVNDVIFWLTQKTRWDIRGVEGLSKTGWYLVNCNHLSWFDIPLLVGIFNGRIPFLRFFAKQAVMWIPVVGLAAWLLDMPFMKRYSRKFLDKHPELRGKDLATTRKACERFRNTPVSIINFLEGTRFTAKKHAQQNSPYRYLLRPKAGGIAYVLAAMGEMFDSMLNVTIIYPKGRSSFWDFLSGRMSCIIVHVEQAAIPQEFLNGDYMNDPVFREQFQAWVRELWGDKDTLIEQVMQESRDNI